MPRPPYRRFLLRYLALLLLKRKTLGTTLERQAARRPEADACRFESERISYAELNRRANRRAHTFAAQGVGQGDVVCLLMENRPEYLETVAGLAKLGAVTALINHQLTGASLAHCIDLAGASRIVVGRECLEAFLLVRNTLRTIAPGGVLVDTRWPDDRPLPEDAQELGALQADAPHNNPPQMPLGSLHPLLYIFTSGTTGLPKAARIHHLRWYAAGLGLGTYALGVRPQDVVYCPLPLYHSNGILIAFAAALVNGATLALARRFSAQGFWAEARQLGATCFVYIGEVLRYLLHQPPSPDERNHGVARILGNGLRPDIWPQVGPRFGIPVIREFYASTEGNAVTVNLDNRPGSVGKAILKRSDNLRLVRYDVANDAYVRDADGYCVPCAPGEVGELLGQIRTLTPFHGYTDPRATAGKILRDVFEPGDAYFRTGDLLRKDADGHYQFVDRIGDTFRWKGENVSTQEVQEVLSALPGLQLVNVFGVAVPGADGRVGMAAVELEPHGAFDPAAFYRRARAHLPSYAVPAFVRVVRQMQLTGTFKLRKTDLQALGFDPNAEAGPVYVLDREGGTYAPLDAATHRRIAAGELPF